MRPQQIGLKPDCFLEQAGALRKTLLLKSDETKDGTGGGSRLRIRKSNLSLLLCLFQLALLNQASGVLQCLTGIDAEGEGRKQE
jgi:hypothetical protein